MKSAFEARRAGSVCFAFSVRGVMFGTAIAAEILDVGETKLIVWDALQPDFPGSPDYEADVSKIIEEFSRETGVAVELKWAERSEALAVLSGRQTPIRTTHLMFSSESAS